MYKFMLSLILFVNLFSITSEAISAKSAILIDSKSGRVIYEQNAHQKLPMASTTKIMTALIACESDKLKDGVKASPFASATEGSSLYLKPGEVQTLEDLTYGLMLKSGNDAAVAIAEYLGGNIDAFALLMNKRAGEIGALNTNFENPHGLDSENHYTTAHDLALISREAMNIRKFREIVSTKTYSIPMQGEKWDRSLSNHNKLLWRFDGCNGIKTGFTKKSGRCLVSSATRGNEEYICVTLNSPDDWNDHMYLLNYGFDNFENKKVFKKNTRATTILYDKEYGRKVDLCYSKDFDIAVDKDDVVTTKIKTKKIKYPAKKGKIAGYAYIYCNGEEIGEIALVTRNVIKKMTLLEKVKFKINKFFFS